MRCQTNLRHGRGWYLPESPYNWKKVPRARPDRQIVSNRRSQLSQIRVNPGYGRSPISPKTSAAGREHRKRSSLSPYPSSRACHRARKGSPDLSAAAEPAQTAIPRSPEQRQWYGSEVQWPPWPERESKAAVFPFRHSNEFFWRNYPGLPAVRSVPHS